MKSLIEFYQDQDTKDNVYNYLVEFLKEEAIKRVFNKEDVSAIADAKDIIDKAWNNMDILFEKKVEKKEIINEAR